MLDVLKRFRSFDPQNYEAYTAPNFGTDTTDTGLSIVAPDFDTLEVMFDAIRNNESPKDADNVPDIDPATIRVGLYNGTGEDGVAAAAEPELVEATMSDSTAGVQVVEIDTAATGPTTSGRSSCTRKNKRTWRSSSRPPSPAQSSGWGTRTRGSMSQ